MDSTPPPCPRHFLALVLLAFFALSRAAAEPAVWEPEFGVELAGLTGQDDTAENVVLSFEFPFQGESYTVVSASNNGGIALGNDPDVLNVIQWHVWHKNSFVLDFSFANFPSLLAFNTDLDQTSTGVVYFNDFGDRAVFTWDGVGTNRTPSQAFISFQIHIYADGRFVFSYLTVNGDLITDLDEGIVVGFSNGVGDPPGGSVDFSNAPISVLSTSYEIWCYDEDPAGDPAASNCYEPGRDNNAGFDFAQDANLLFEPDGTGGILVRNEPEVTPDPPPVVNPPPPLPSGGGGGSGPVTMLLLFMMAISYRRRRLPA